MKFYKNLNFDWGHSLVASLSSLNKTGNNDQKLYKNKFLKSPMDYLTPHMHHITGYTNKGVCDEQ